MAEMSPRSVKVIHIGAIR